MSLQYRLPYIQRQYDRLRDTYGSVAALLYFNLWIELTQAHLDNAPPSPLSAKLNEARVKLSNAGNGCL